ncbi:MAG TPA: LOG family protein [Candidatus Aminicenantes bacterium]|nr:LOG family protein [Candidatus Aminicenantes bacterium]
MKRAPKAYKNKEFLQSHHARPLRILAEYLEPESRFHELGILHSVVFFGSARVKSSREGGGPTARYYDAAEELAYLISNWAKEQGSIGRSLAICSGGGPGIMEAANRGASRASFHSIGLNVSLPHEQFPNPYISPELNFEFHYFFMRKLWFLFHAKALICFPGGFGTMDELFETLTLVQTHKVHKQNLSIMLFDREYWRNLINFDKLVDHGFIARQDLDLFHFFDSPATGMTYLEPRLLRCIEAFNQQENGTRSQTLQYSPILPPEEE